MISFFIGALFLAIPVSAQTGGICSVADCPSSFMPTPASSSAAKKIVALALAAVKAAVLKEDAAVVRRNARYEQIRAQLQTETSWYRKWMINEETVRAAALSDADYLQKSNNLRTAIDATYRAQRGHSQSRYGL